MTAVFPSSLQNNKMVHNLHFGSTTLAKIITDTTNNNLTPPQGNASGYETQTHQNLLLLDIREAK